MMDEMWMRGWNDCHERFSKDVGDCAALLAGAISRLRRRRDSRDAQVRSKLGLRDFGS